MAQWQGQELDKKTHLWELYEKGLDFQNQIGLRDSLPTYVSFYEGKQWPNPTPSTKNLPRPVINIVKMICRSKKASILSTPVRIHYKSYSPLTDTGAFNDFASYVLKELGQEELDKQAIDDGVKKGSYFYHYYWDPNASGIDGQATGGVRCELIDPLNIFFSDPSELNEQKQDWILIASRRSLEKIATLCDKNISTSTLKSDEGENLYGTREQNADKTATLLTRYFKQNGEIYCERATKEQIINKPFRITPNSDNVAGEAQNDKAIQDKGASPSNTNESVATLFPIVCGYYERKESSIYGLSEVEGIIPNQKAINFNIAMSLLNAQECAWGKYIALPNALKNQKISNSPGQVLIDYSGTGNGIKRMSESSLSDAPMNITSKLTELTRAVSGTTEVMTGEAYNSNMSGAAIAYLQAQANMPIEELRGNFYIVKRKQGKVLAQFLKLFYYKSSYIRKEVSTTGEEKEVFALFSSKDYENSIFDVVVEAIGGSKASIASDISLLDTCLKNGSISLDTYIKAYPESAITNKQELLKQIELERSSELSRLRKEIELYKTNKN
ncbi:MAG: hypothetical protein IJ004_01750 [Clostridia bacterium]|nr:hypothetical protein [Clostridia bacterium]